MKIYDKAQWHIDAGENKEIVVAKFQAVYVFLQNKGLLSDEGREIYELGIDGSISLNERMVTDAGGKFLERFYDEVIDFSEIQITQELEKKYSVFVSEKE